MIKNLMDKKARLYFLFAAILLSLPTLLSFYKGHEGKLLVATEMVDGDKNFRQTVIYIFDHSIWGAKGIVINRPLLPLSIESLGIKKADIQYFKGGPVAYPRVKIVALNRPKNISHWRSQGVYVISLKNLPKIFPKHNAEKDNIYLGYAGWKSGQLEREIKNNMWIIGDYDPSFIGNVGGRDVWRELVKNN